VGKIAAILLLTVEEVPFTLIDVKYEFPNIVDVDTYCNS